MIFQPCSLNAPQAAINRWQRGCRLTTGTRRTFGTPIGLLVVPETGRLKVVLPEFEPPTQLILAVYPTRRHLAPKVRAAIDYFAEEFALDPALRLAVV